MCTGEQVADLECKLESNCTALLADQPQAWISNMPMHMRKYMWHVGCKNVSVHVSDIVGMPAHIRKSFHDGRRPWPPRFRTCVNEGSSISCTTHAKWSALKVCWHVHTSKSLWQHALQIHISWPAWFLPAAICQLHTNQISRLDSVKPCSISGILVTQHLWCVLMSSAHAGCLAYICLVVYMHATYVHAKWH